MDQAFDKLVAQSEEQESEAAQDFEELEFDEDQLRELGESLERQSQYLLNQVYDFSFSSDEAELDTSEDL